MRKSGKREKIPYSPTTGEKADPTDQTTWGSFEEACVAASIGYEGIGYMFSADDAYTGIDLDHCRNPETGQLQGWAQSHVVQLDSYTEVSPSHAGVHIIVRGKKPGKRSRKGDVEMYDTAHFFTMTGQHLADTPTTIENRAAEVCALYACLFQQDASEPNQQKEVGLPKEWSDEDLLLRARRGKKGAQFWRLWQGDRSDYLDSEGKPDESRADLALCRHLAFWTGRDRERIDQLFRQSGLMRPKWERATYRKQTIASAIDSTKQTYTGTASPEQAVEVEEHDAPWLHSDESADERAKRLKDAAKRVEAEVRRARREKDGRVTVINLPPGVGKTHVVAALGKHTFGHPLGKLNIGLIVERKDQLKQPIFKDWHKQEGCTPQNCPDGYELHRAYAERGYNTAVIHKAHNCLYWQQMEREGSTGYQVEHVGTSYVREHDLIVIDEWNVGKWIPAHYFHVGDLQAAAGWYAYTEGANLLLGAFASVVGGVHEPLQGKPLFDAVNRRCGGKLAEIVEALYADETVMEARPWAETDVLAEVVKLPPVIVPLLVRVLHGELPKWQTGKDWNSHIRMAQQPGEDGQSDPEWKLCISERRRFRRTPDALIVMDATADQRIQELFWRRPVTMVRTPLEPAAGTRHIAVRTGKGYRKTGLTTAENAAKNRDRVQRELQYVLHNHCPNGELGLITFKSILDELGDALDIPAEVGGKKRRLNFWGQRGSNDLTGVDVLVVVGTPVWNPQDIARMGRVLWSEDEQPIDERFEDGRFVDERLQHLSNHITRSELTQAAHRNRALRHPNKTIITLCDGEIDYLPPTTTVTRLGKLTENGETRVQASVAREERIAAAYVEMACEGVVVNGRTLAKRAGVRKMTGYAWLKEHRHEMEERAA
jgi:hypothetical protein